MFYSGFQLYFLTVLTTIFAGFALVEEFLSRRFTRFAENSEFMSHPIYLVTVGIVTFFVGFINLFPTYQGDIAVIGELLPSLAGMVAGVLLLVKFFISRPSEGENKTKDIAERIEFFSRPYLVFFGFLTIGIGVFHAILPELPLL